jgi:hypothetical protein
MVRSCEGDKLRRGRFAKEYKGACKFGDQGVLDVWGSFSGVDVGVETRSDPRPELYQRFDGRAK